MTMYGNPLPIIVPTSADGTELAEYLNDWKLYLASTRRGNVHPVGTEWVEGCLWYRDLGGSKALMLTVSDGGNGLIDQELFRFEDDGGKIFDGIEVAIGPGLPADPAEGDIWFIPGGVNDGNSSVTNWQSAVYSSGAWYTFVDVANANLVVSTTLGEEPDLGSLQRHYGLMWMDATRGEQTIANNNGLMVWNGTSYVPSWPVVDGQSMLKVAADAGNGSPISPATIGLAQIRTGGSTPQYWFATGSEWIDLAEKVPFVTTAEEAVGGSTTLAMSPFWTHYAIDEYRKANVIQIFDAATWGDMVETIGAGANIGKIDSSLTITTGLGYQGTFTATGSTVATEYPPEPWRKGDYWIYLNDPSWTFTSGDLSLPTPQTINKGEGLVLNALGKWEIVDVLLNTDLFVHRDGSLAVYQPLPFTNPSAGDQMLLDYKSILFAAGITYMLAPAAAPAAGLRVTDTGLVGAGNTTPTAPLYAQGTQSATPGRTSNIFKVAADTWDTQWLGLRYDSAQNVWSWDTESAGTSHSRMVINQGNGYVGIGVEDPLYPLHVGGAGVFVANLTTNSELFVGGDANFGTLVNSHVAIEHEKVVDGTRLGSGVAIAGEGRWHIYGLDSEYDLLINLNAMVTPENAMFRFQTTGHLWSESGFLSGSYQGQPRIAVNGAILQIAFEDLASTMSVQYAGGSGQGLRFYDSLGPDVLIRGGKVTAGTLNLSNLPSDTVGLVSGDVWNNAGVLNIVP